MSLVFGNRTTNDILLKEELLSYAENHKGKFKLFLTVDQKPHESEDWKMGVGFITQEMLMKNMPAPSPETLICYCGPPPFEAMMKEHLEAMGYDPRGMIFKF